MTAFAFNINPALLSFSLQTEINEEVYELRLYINRRDGYWYMDFRKPGGEQFNGIKLVTGQDLLRPFRYSEDVPPGAIVCVDLDGLDRDPTETNFGDRILLAYVEDD